MGSGFWAQWLSASRKELEFQEEARVKGYFLEKLKARNVLINILEMLHAAKSRH